MKRETLLWLTSALVLALGGSLAHAKSVKITPLGMRTGEFCAPDRAFLFEDPTGVRILGGPDF